MKGETPIAGAIIVHAQLFEDRWSSERAISRRHGEFHRRRTIGLSVKVEKGED